MVDPDDLDQENVELVDSVPVGLPAGSPEGGSVRTYASEIARLGPVSASRSRVITQKRWRSGCPAQRHARLAARIGIPTCWLRRCSHSSPNCEYYAAFEETLSTETTKPPRTTALTVSWPLRAHNLPTVTDSHR